MSKTWLLIKHEFLVMVRRKGFIILTLLIPAIALLGILAGQIIPSLVKTSTQTTHKIGYVDYVGNFTTATSEGNINLIKFGTESAAKTALLNKDLEEYFVIPSDYLATGFIQRYTLKSEIEMSSASQTAIRDFLLTNLLQGSSPDIIARVKSPLNVASTTFTSSGEIAKQQGGIAALILPYIFSILLMMSIFSSSGYLLQGLGEEKENRVMEILLSSVSSGQLLMGKVIGLGAAGLLQILIWLISANFIFRIASSSFSSILGTLNVTPEFLILGVLYFILGYLLVAIGMAGAGAVAPTARDGQQLSVLFTLPVIIPIYFMGLIMTNPENIVVKILTFFPVTAPITVMVRLGISGIPIWELAVSITLLVLSIFGGFVLTRKLFRTYLLMYGKRPDLKQIMLSFKNS